MARASFVRNLPLRDNQRSENVRREGDTRAEDVVPVSVQLAGTGVLRTLGIPLLDGVPRQVELKLRSTRRFSDGVVRIHYEVDRTAPTG